MYIRGQELQACERPVWSRALAACRSGLTNVPILPAEPRLPVGPLGHPVSVSYSTSMRRFHVLPLTLALLPYDPL